MTRIQYVSDLHIEYGNVWDRCIIPDAKYLILAGDIAPIYHSKLPSFYDWCHHNFDLTLHVPGNHEYYGNSIYKVESKMKDLCSKYGIIYGQKSVICIEDLKIVSCTLWTHSNVYCNDYKHILLFNTHKRNYLYQDHCDFLYDNVDSESLVVTHHAPLIEYAQREDHIGDINTSLYCNNLPGLVDRSKAWIYGHTHYVSDNIRDNGVIVTTNPVGSKKENLPYAKSCVITL